MNLKNKVQLIPHVDKHPEVKAIKSRNTLGKFSKATNESYLNNPS